MTKESPPELGRLPEPLQAKVIQDPEAFFGRWIEADKPLAKINTILARLGVSAVKRRIVARCHCMVEIEAGKSATAESGSVAAQTPTRTDDGTDLTSTAANTPGGLDGTWGEGLALVMRQHFPMGRVRESAFVADGETIFDQEDPETDIWKATVWFENGLLIQRRKSAKLGLIMYDTRAVLSEPVALTDLDGGGSVEGLDSTQPAQVFQWTLVDPKTEDSWTAWYYLKRPTEEEAMPSNKTTSSTA